MKYYMHTGGQQLGPFEESELLSHGLTASTMVWREGMPDWVAASQVPELSHLLPPIQQPPGYQPQPQPGYGSQPQRPAMPATYLVWAILATLLCYCEHCQGFASEQPLLSRQLCRGTCSQPSCSQLGYSECCEQWCDCTGLCGSLFWCRTHRATVNDVS